MKPPADKACTMAPPKAPSPDAQQTTGKPDRSRELEKHRQKRLSGEVDGKSERIHIALNPAELAAIDDYRFANRIPTRSEAIRRLIEAGLNNS
jgi:hypothetical protein